MDATRLIISYDSSGLSSLRQHPESKPHCVAPDRTDPQMSDGGVGIDGGESTGVWRESVVCCLVV